MHAAPSGRLLEAVMVSSIVHTVIVLGLINTLASASTLAEANRRRCGNPPSKVTRVQLVSSTATTLGLGEVRRVVERTWQTDGLEFEWVDTPRPQRLADVDVTVIVAESLLLDAPPQALGAVRFVAGQPQNFVRVSTSAIVKWFTERMIASQLWPRGTHVRFSDQNAIGMMERALAYVIAHEIGHVLLASKEHSREGVMRASYVDVHGLAAGAPLMTLDDAARERLRLRMAGLALCE
jgi:hypothetical protein